MVIFEALHKDYGRFGPANWKYTRYSVLESGTVVCDSETGTSLWNRIFKKGDRNAVYDPADPAQEKTEKALSGESFARLKELLEQFSAGDVTAVSGDEDWILTSFDKDEKPIRRTEGSVAGVKLLEDIIEIIR